VKRSDLVKWLAERAGGSATFALACVRAALDATSSQPDSPAAVALQPYKEEIRASISQCGSNWQTKKWDRLVADAESEALPGHKCRGARMMFHTSCECGWTSGHFSSRSDAYHEWRYHRGQVHKTR